MHIHFTLTMAIIMGLICASMNRMHLMSTLLCIEALTMIMFLMMALPPVNTTNMTLIPIMMMTIGACEAGAGLTLVTITKQKNSNDYIKNLNLLKC